jgi:hypothetical protein
LAQMAKKPRQSECNQTHKLQRGARHVECFAI